MKDAFSAIADIDDTEEKAATSKAPEQKENVEMKKQMPNKFE